MTLMYRFFTRTTKNWWSQMDPNMIVELVILNITMDCNSRNSIDIINPKSSRKEDFLASNFQK